MRIERVIFRGLRALRARDDRFVGSGGECLPAVCLRGLNGTGKTTYLEALAQLWQWFRRCTRKRDYVRPSADTELLGEARVVAALFTGLPGPKPRLWIAWGKVEELDFLLDDPANPYLIEDGRPVWSQEILQFWDEAFTSPEAGIEYQRFPPNIVWIEAENKYVPELRVDELTTPLPSRAFYPVSRYLPKARGPSHLEGLMRTLFLARRDRWEILVQYLHELRPGLELLDSFDEKTQRPRFRLSTGEILTADRLSAGERSILINLCMILRWLGPGGIVLLDEPELHQHISLMRSSLSVIDQLIDEKFHGQLLVASHAPEVWDYFRRTDAIVDLGDSST